MNLSVPIIILIAVVGLLGIGIYCLLITRNMICIVVGLQILPLAASAFKLFIRSPACLSESWPASFAFIPSAAVTAAM